MKYTKNGSCSLHVSFGGVLDSVNIFVVVIADVCASFRLCTNWQEKVMNLRGKNVIVNFNEACTTSTTQFAFVEWNDINNQAILSFFCLCFGRIFFALFWKLRHIKHITCTMIKDVTIAAGHRLDGAHKSKKEIIPRKRSFRAQHRKQQNTEKYSFSIRIFSGFLVLYLGFAYFFCVSLSANGLPFHLIHSILCSTLYGKTLK